VHAVSTFKTAASAGEVAKPDHRVDTAQDLIRNADGMQENAGICIAVSECPQISHSRSNPNHDLFNCLKQIGVNRAFTEMCLVG
jgi:hypothetical protein